MARISNLRVPAEVGPQAQQQLCVFTSSRTSMSMCWSPCDVAAENTRVGGRKRLRGRPSIAQQRRRRQNQRTDKDESYFIWKHGRLLVYPAGESPIPYVRLV